jgi:hypothetical protein
VRFSRGDDVPPQRHNDLIRALSLGYDGGVP